MVYLLCSLAPFKQLSFHLPDIHISFVQIVRFKLFYRAILSIPVLILGFGFVLSSFSSDLSKLKIVLDREDESTS